ELGKDAALLAHYEAAKHIVLPLLFEAYDGAEELEK
ncbi:MAG: hypothetical protein ACI9S8_001350, partial [Chlamydiales bacterium]